VAYTDKQRQAAIDLWHEHGTAETSRQTGIPTRTITRWLKQAGLGSAQDTDKQKQLADARKDAAVTTVRRWTEFREQEAVNAAAVASNLRNKMMEVVNGMYEARQKQPRESTVIPPPLPTSADLRSLAISYGILIDKAELLSGHATERVEHIDAAETDRELRELVSDMERRRDEQREGTA